MKFSEKLSVLFSITATTNAAIARGIKVDGAQISRMKTGARGMPLKKEMIRAMSDYLARHCDSEYRLSALYELTADMRLQMHRDDQVVSDVIFDWLTAPEIPGETQAGQSFDGRNRASAGERHAPVEKAKRPPLSLGEKNFLSYSGNSGKRQAVRDFLSYLYGQEEPLLVRTFSDECADWLKEDPLFVNEVAQGANRLVRKGHRGQRIQPPLVSPEYSKRVIEQWMPAYLAGTVRQYRYPWARDDLHRRTLLVVPGHIVFTAMSLSGQKESPLIMLTTDRKTVDLYNSYFDGILAKCKPVMNTFTLEDPEKVFDLMIAIEKVDAEGYYKFRTLSPLTLPPDIQKRIGEQGSALAGKISAALEKRIAHRHRVLQNHRITEIMRLPPLQEVLAGKTVIPATRILEEEKLYYTPEEYRRHLAQILSDLETYSNYSMILSQDLTLQGIALYAKSDERVFVIQEELPAVVLEIKDQTLAASFYAYLEQLAQKERQDEGKKQVLSRLKEEIALVEQAMALKNRA